MDGILEQILLELKELNKNIKDNGFTKNEKQQSNNITMTSKQAAKYLGVSECFLRTATVQKKIMSIRVGNRYLYRKITLDDWIKETEAESIRKEEKNQDYGKLRKVKE